MKKNNFLIFIIVILVILLAVCLVIIYQNNYLGTKTEVLSSGENVTSEESLKENTTEVSNVAEENDVVEEITDEERQAVEEYVKVVCNGIMKIDEFDNINEANKEWIYSHLLTNGKEYGDYLTAEQIQTDLTQIFGTDLVVNVKNDTDSSDGYFIPINKGDNKYEFIPVGGMIEVDYAVNSIEKEQNIYTINLIEYSIQFDKDSSNPEENYAVFSYNPNVTSKWEKVFNLEINKNEDVIKKVIESKDKFLSYNLIIEKINEKSGFKVLKLKQN